LLLLLGLGLGVTDQLPPFKVSTRVWDPREPTATQKIELVQDMPYREFPLLLGLGLGVTDQPPSLRVSTSVWFPLEPTATQLVDPVQDTPYRKLPKLLL
jgi:hypothetical protein